MARQLQEQEEQKQQEPKPAPKKPEPEINPATIEELINLNNGLDVEVVFYIDNRSVDKR